jgi:hypothetical protein
MFSNWALANLRKATSSLTTQEGAAKAVLKVKDNDIRLKRSEEIRIFRALYRYEAYYRLFGRNRGRRHGAFRHHEINELFFYIFDPWEAEAVGCIDLFVRQRYKDIFDEVKEDLHPQNIKFRQEDGVYNYDGSFDLTVEHDGKHDLPPHVKDRQSTMRYAGKKQFSSANLAGNRLHGRHHLSRPENDSAAIGN